VVTKPNPADEFFQSWQWQISLVDVAQSAGVIPIDLRQWAADFVVDSCVKWLCGGPDSPPIYNTTQEIHTLGQRFKAIGKK